MRWIIQDLNVVIVFDVWRCLGVLGMYVYVCMYGWVGGWVGVCVCVVVCTWQIDPGQFSNISSLPAVLVAHAPERVWLKEVAPLNVPSMAA